MTTGIPPPPKKIKKNCDSLISNVAPFHLAHFRTNKKVADFSLFSLISEGTMDQFFCVVAIAPEEKSYP